MAVKAQDTKPGVKYRPTRPSNLWDIGGRSWLTRSSPGWERKAIVRLRRKARHLNGRETYMLSLLEKESSIFMRRHTKKPGVKDPQSEWVTIPKDYLLRTVKK